MFTGLIDAVAEVVDIQLDSNAAFLKLKLPYQSLSLGESIAINGVCLTLLNAQPEAACFNISSETLSLTNLSHLQVGDVVNCERALEAHSRIGGHWVTGHVDTVAQVISLETLGEYVKLLIGRFTETQKLFLIKKGSVTVDGVSLTINELKDTGIELMLIPHTIKHTSFSKLTMGQLVNIEFDYMTRTIAHQLKMMLNDSHFKTFLTQG
jgi:riboflavin synthase